MTTDVQRLAAAGQLTPAHFPAVRQALTSLFPDPHQAPPLVHQLVTHSLGRAPMPLATQRALAGVLGPPDDPMDLD